MSSPGHQAYVYAEQLAREDVTVSMVTTLMDTLPPRNQWQFGYRWLDQHISAQIVPRKDVLEAVIVRMRDRRCESVRTLEVRAFMGTLLCLFVEGCAGGHYKQSPFRDRFGSLFESCPEILTFIKSLSQVSLEDDHGDSFREWILWTANGQNDTDCVKWAQKWFPYDPQYKSDRDTFT